MLYRRGNTWWYKFRFAGQIFRESAKTKSKALAGRAERKRRTLPSYRFLVLATREGFEPPTPSSEDWCSNPLSYASPEPGGGPERPYYSSSRGTREESGSG